MTIADIAGARLRNQQIAPSETKKLPALVRWLGATQAQDYAAAKWALGLRLPGSTDNEIEQAFNKGEILRTHIMRPTWHFVAPEDIRWMTKLTSPRVKAQCAFMDRKMELTEVTFNRCNKMLVKALKGNRYLTRSELGVILAKNGIVVNDLRLTCIMMRAELDGIVCSGPRNGKQFTYALIEERVPYTKPFKREEALKALAQLYYTSRGPATIQDFVWWSGLTTTDAKAAIEVIRSKMESETIGGKPYWFSPATQFSKAKGTCLLPNYDEYIIAYKHREAAFDPGKYKPGPRGNVIFNNTIIIDGKVVGTWKRALFKDRVMIEPITFNKPTKTQVRLISEAAENYGAFLGLKTEVTVSSLN